MPTDTELHAAYCVAVLQRDVAVMQSAIEQANRYLTESELKAADLPSELAENQSRLARFQLYIAPRVPFLEAYPLLESTRIAEADMRESRALLDSCAKRFGVTPPVDSSMAACMHTCSAGELMTRLESCRDPDGRSQAEQPLTAHADSTTESIPLKSEGGTYVVPVLINEKITLDFTLDSGAADVSIPLDVFSTLQRTHTISKEDLLEPGVYQLADGSTHRQVRFRIRSLKVGNLELHDVVESVASARGVLLLGQSFLSRLQSWSVDNQRHVLVVSGGVAEAAMNLQAKSSSSYGQVREQGPDYSCGAAQNICRDGDSSLCADYQHEFAQKSRVCPGVYDPDCTAAQKLCHAGSPQCVERRLELRREGDDCPGVTDVRN